MFYPLQDLDAVASMNQIFLLQLFLVTANSVAIAAFGIDKLKSKRGGSRIPERELLLLAFFGPFGAYAGMLLFKHKIRKAKFLLVPVFLLFHAVLLIFYFK